MERKGNVILRLRAYNESLLQRVGTSDHQWSVFDISLFIFFHVLCMSPLASDEKIVVKISIRLV